MAAGASVTDSLAPCATEEFEIVEPGQLEGALEVDAFWGGTENGAFAQSCYRPESLLLDSSALSQEEKPTPRKTMPHFGNTQDLMQLTHLGLSGRGVHKSLQSRAGSR